MGYTIGFWLRSSLALSSLVARGEISFPPDRLRGVYSEMSEPAAKMSHNAWRHSSQGDDNQHGPLRHGVV